MANRTLLLCLFIFCTLLFVTECRRSGGGGSRSRGGSSSWGKSWGGGSSYKPSSSSSGTSWWSSSSSGSSYKPSSSRSSGSSYPSSATGLSGSGSGSRGYPSSTGLSGSSSISKSSYPWSSSGLSGSSSKSSYPSYPSSSTGLSGFGSNNNNKYPSSGSSSGTHSYPSGTGLSGSGSGNQRYPTGSGTHSYPSGTGLSGSGTGGNTWSHNNYGSNGVTYRPSHTYNTNSGYGSGYHPGSYVPTYYHYPQHIYVTQYQDSGSRYGDLLTGLTLYNLGRSHNHYHNNYYYDDYYRNRYSSSTSNAYGNNNHPKDEAVCSLRIKENGQIQQLKIPCEIVSTFTDQSDKVNNPNDTRINTTVCTTNTTVIKRIKPEDVVVNTTSLPLVSSTSMPIISTTNGSSTNVSALNITSEVVINKENLTDTTTSDGIATTIDPRTTPPVVTSTENSTINLVQNTSTTNRTEPVPHNATTISNTKNVTGPITIVKNTTEGNTTKSTVRVITSTEEIVNVTICKTDSILTDPLSVKGGSINPSAMECSVDIKTKEAYFRHNVDCKTLMKYSKSKPPPSQTSSILPEKEKLKSWLSKPPWWMSIFIAV